MSAAEITVRYGAGELRRFGAALFQAVGMEAEKAEAVAGILVEADMLGHDTHGLALAPRYLDAIEAGGMNLTGEPEVVNDRGACVTWNGRLLPGPWLVLRAMELAMERAAVHGLCAVAIGNSHHIGCLAAYLRRAAERGMVLSIHSSAPGVATVAPFGGTRAALSPAPFAFGFPTGDDAVLIDVSASITTNNMAMRLAKEGRRYPRPWLMDAEGEATDDPSVLQRGGTVLPAGGQDHGQKGYGWGLTAEALSQGLSGHGRADGPKGMTNAVFLQVFDPTAFAGLDAFNRQTDAITANCRSSPPRPGLGAVRLPGEAGLRRRAVAERQGVALRDGILETLQPWAAKLGLALPGAPAF
ncbi:L-lactate dehydrogenase [Roseomonas rosea]|uniref:L-lactate dehydrogenase n=1 Tax=Muricoccus roseus TaxID=198092 RepID=A0A1M6KJW4_9PROT|nr:Ldh family oxidoreductase [Roseomonas rosea]SHJ59267.1 L-lactate dehydrogenase [Roseomonas rosea]